MALARALCVALVGVDGRIVEVEADLAAGLPALTLIGLPDVALQEARDRVRAAVVNSGEEWPRQRITVGLFPATLPKSGSSFDAAVAVAVLAAAGALPAAALAGRVVLGELALDGRLRPVRGVLPAVLTAVRAGIGRVVVPAPNRAEAALVPDVVVEPVADLAGLLGLLRGDVPPFEPGAAVDLLAPPPSPSLDLADVRGQAVGRMAVEVAAAGGHHLLLQGPPGSGKTMLAERLPALLPDLDRTAALEVTAVHSVAGVLPPDCPLVSRPPFRDPHHSASTAALIGGGSGSPRPGLVSQAHRGVLFLDEAPEFARGALDALRQPLESGVVEIARARGSARFPARFQLVLAANPCPCARAGGLGDTCSCAPQVRRRYQARLSGPLLDRVDLRISVFPATRAELIADRAHVEQSAAVAERVRTARAATARRLGGTPWRTNAEVPGPELRERWPLRRAATRTAEDAFDRGDLTARGFDRVLRVAWTFADLGGRPEPSAIDVDSALMLRLPEGR